MGVFQYDHTGFLYMPGTRNFQRYSDCQEKRGIFFLCKHSNYPGKLNVEAGNGCMLKNKINHKSYLKKRILAYKLRKMIKEKQQIWLATDALVFGYSDGAMHVLLIQKGDGKYKGGWVLPGGFVKDKEELVQAACRELKEETGIDLKSMEQVGTFGGVNRDYRGRVVSVAFMALVKPETLSVMPDTDAVDARWFPIDNLPKLGFDHKDIVKAGLNQLRHNLAKSPVVFDLLNREFLFSDLENIYVSLSEYELDRRNFRKKWMSFDILDESPKLSTQSQGRPAKMYRFNKKRFQQLQKAGYVFEVKFA